jgi:hypothetical protein
VDHSSQLYVHRQRGVLLRREFGLAGARPPGTGTWRPFFLEMLLLFSFSQPPSSFHSLFPSLNESNEREGGAPTLGKLFPGASVGKERHERARRAVEWLVTGETEVGRAHKTTRNKNKKTVCFPISATNHKVAARGGSTLQP